MAGLSCQEALTRYKYDARFTPKKEGEKNVLVGALNRSVSSTGGVAAVKVPSLPEVLIGDE